jgi:hypothetical protein
MEGRTHKISLQGRKRGAIGITYRITDVITLKDGQELGDAIYEKYELIQSLRVDGKQLLVEKLKFKTNSQ